MFFIKIKRSSVDCSSVERSCLKRFSVVFCLYFVFKLFVKAPCIYCVFFGFDLHSLARFITFFLWLVCPHLLFSALDIGFTYSSGLAWCPFFKFGLQTVFYGCSVLLKFQVVLSSRFGVIPSRIF